MTAPARYRHGWIPINSAAKQQAAARAKKQSDKPFVQYAQQQETNAQVLARNPAPADYTKAPLSVLQQRAALGDTKATAELARRDRLAKAAAVVKTKRKAASLARRTAAHKRAVVAHQRALTAHQRAVARHRVALQRHHAAQARKAARAKAKAAKGHHAGGKGHAKGGGGGGKSLEARDAARYMAAAKATAALQRKMGFRLSADLQNFLDLANR